MSPEALKFAISGVALLVTTTAHAANHCLIRADHANGVLIVSIESPQDLLAEFQARASKGLTVTLIHNVNLNLASSKDSLRKTSFGCRVYFDPWDQNFHISPVDSARGAHKPIETRTTLSPIPKPCTSGQVTWKEGRVVAANSATLLDPVDDEQLQRTQHWLAARGIGKDSSGMVGRAVAAMIDLKDQRNAKVNCEIVAK